MRRFHEKSASGGETPAARVDLADPTREAPAELARSAGASGSAVPPGGSNLRLHLHALESPFAHVLSTMISNPAGSPKPCSGLLITPGAPASAEEFRLASFAWYRSAPGLADLALANLVCRGDCYGGYRVDHATGQVHQTTHWAVPDAARPDRRLAPPLDQARLAHHFRGISGLDSRLGCHVADARGGCLWAVIDLDAHGPEDDPGANARMASRVVASLIPMGLPFRVEDSDGRGGLHIWILFGRKAPQAWAFRFGKYLVRDFADCGLARPPESFPKASEHSGMRCGNFVRLPGLHHKREHWSRIWSPEEGRWLGPDEGIESLLSFRGDPKIDLAPLIPADFVPAAKKVAQAKAGSRPALPAGATSAFPAQVDGEPAEVAMARSAIASLGVDAFEDYEDWIRLGMALKPLGDAGLELWADASESSPKYPGYDELEAKWWTLREAQGPREIGLGSLYHRANEAGWDGQYAVTAIATGPHRRRSNILDDPGKVVSKAMSDDWDEDFDRQAEALKSRRERIGPLADKLGLTPEGLETVFCSLKFGLKPTNRGRRTDGSRGPLGPAWTCRETNGAGRTVGIRRLFAGPQGLLELGCGHRSTKRANQPDRVTRVSRRGLLTNVAEAAPDAARVYLVRGLLDFAAVAARRLPCVRLPAGGTGDREAGLGDLARLLEGDDRPLIVPYRTGSPDPWVDARGPALALGRKLGAGILVQGYPAEYGSIGEFVSSTRTGHIRGDI